MTGYQLTKMLEAAMVAKEQAKQLTTDIKNKVLRELATVLRSDYEFIQQANQLDIIQAKEEGMTTAFVDRLLLNRRRIEAMADSLIEVAMAEDPLNQELNYFRLGSGVKVRQVSVPLGLIAMIYESRPNVTIEATALAFKAGNAIVLRGSANALHSNRCLVGIIQQVLEHHQLDKALVQLIDDGDRQLVDQLIQANQQVDVLIPRGGKALKQYINRRATIPVIETGAGICHIYLDGSYNLEKSVELIINAKTQRPGTCNSVECLLFDRRVTDHQLVKISDALLAHQVEIRYTSEIKKRLQGVSYPELNQIITAKQEDFPYEYLDKIIAGKQVASLDEAIQYINRYASHHSDVILTDDSVAADRFLQMVDSAVVYHNASPRFSDGGQFGFGGEVGISTQKLHARGPMGLVALTTYKYLATGDGQIRS